MAKYLDSEGLSTLWERIQTLANINGIEYIVGTQDEATNAWEGTSKDKACGNGTLYTGKVIVYHLPVAGTSTAATLNLTLPDGTTTGAKDVHRLASSTVTTTFAEGCDIFMVYNGTRWKVSAYVDANTNTIGYQLRSNSYSKAMTDITYRYRLLFSSADNSKWTPANTSSSTNATSSRAVCQTPINPFGEIVYYGTTASVAAGSRPSAAALWQQYTLSLGYSFNRTGAALELTSWKPVYVKCAPQANGSAIIDADNPYVQDLPSTEDGKIYIFLGVAYSATAIELLMNHPVFYYKDGAIRQWNNAAETDFVVDFVYDENEEDYVCSKTYSEITAALAANRKVVGVAKYNNAIQGIYSNVYTTDNSVYFVQLDEGEGSSPEIFSFILSNADELTTSTHRLLQDTDGVIRGANNIWCSITIGSNDAVTVSNNPFTDFDSYIFGNEQSVILKASVTYNSASYSHDVLIHAKYTGTGAANRKYIGVTPLEYTNNKYLYLEFTNTTASGKVVEFYSKPSTGIPSTDLASAVQTSLGKADTALQPDVANDIAQGSITSSTGQGFDFIVDSDDNVLQDVLDAKANDSAVVHKTGNETIAGNKTFSGNAIFSDLDNVLIGNTSISEIMEDTYAAKDEMAVTVSGNNTTITLNENLSTTVLNDIPDNIAYIEADSGEGEAYTGGYQLPAVTSEDNGKILSVSGGSWAKTENPSYLKTETYNKEEVNNLITSPESDVVIGALPASGTANTIYRVPSTNSYSDYGWDGTQFVLLATYDNAIDDVPTAGSDNLVKSGGVQSALDELESNIYDSTVFSKTEMFDIDKNNVGSNNSSYITIAKTDTGLTINCVQIGSSSVYCSILGLSVGRTYKLSFNYQYSGIGNVTYPGNFGIRNKPNTNGTFLKGWVLGKMAPSGTINDTFTPNTTSLYFVVANADLNKVGATVDISNISFLEELSLKDKISSTAEETERFSEAAELLGVEDIDTSSLPVSKYPSSATNISIDNTAPNEYTITNTSKTGSTYALIRMPVLTVGQKYKLRFKYTCNSSIENVFGLATSGRVWSSSNLSKTNLPGSATNLQYEAIFTYATSQYYLMFYSNNMISGAVLVLKDFKITPVDSYEDVIDRIENLEGDGFIPTDYSGAYVGTQIDLGNKTYYYKATKVFSSVAGGQGMAMFDNYIFRTQNGGTCYLYETDGITATQLWSSSVADGGHSNSAQFSPLVESDNDFPYLYISLCANPRQGCKVCKVTTEGIEVVQTIMLDNEAFSDGKNVNVQVGDDGYLYVFGLSFKIWKVRLPSVSEGDVTLTANDIIESFSINLPYSTYPWQGGTIYNGKLFVPTGFGGNNVSRFIVVIDLSSHVITKINITNVVTQEPEDCDIVNSSLYMAVDGSGMYKFDFL